MYRIVIADDETIVIDALRFIIEKNFPDQCEIETAKSGRTLIERAEALRPDIAFVDLMMPGIGGIAAMREIRKNNKDIIFIVVSAFNEFDYAKEAIQLGVMEYVNKPIERDRIVSVLQMAMDRVDEGKNRRSASLRTQEKLEIVVPMIENGLIYAFLNARAGREEIDGYIRLLDLSRPQGNMMAIRFGDVSETGELTNPVGAGVRLHEEYERIRQMVRSHFQEVIVGALMGNMLAAWLPCEELGEEEAYAERVRQIERARTLVQDVCKTLGVRLRIAFGGLRTVYEAWESYQDALRAFSFGTSVVTHAGDLNLGAHYEGDYPAHLEKKLFGSVEDGDLAAALAAADSFFEWMVQSHGDAITDIKLKCLEFVLRTESIGYSAGGETYRFRSRSGYLEEIMAMVDFDALRKWFLEKITEACRRVADQRTQNASDLTENARRYIEEHYGRDISLDDISAQAGVSPYYFSKLFKKRTGQTFVEYLTEVRMGKARELLRETDYSMKEISTEVGYGDQNYFSRAFRKYVGVSPSEYRAGLTEGTGGRTSLRLSETGDDFPEDGDPEE